MAQRAESPTELGRLLNKELLMIKKQKKYIQMIYDRKVDYPDKEIWVWVTGMYPYDVHDANLIKYIYQNIANVLIHDNSACETGLLEQLDINIYDLPNNCDTSKNYKLAIIINYDEFINFINFLIANNYEVYSQTTENTEKYSYDYLEYSTVMIEYEYLKPEL